MTTLGGALLSAPGYAQSTTDLFDQSRGGVIVSASSTAGGFGPEGMIGALTTGEGNAGNTIFNGGGTVANPNFVVFSTPSLVSISGIRLFVAQDSTTDASRGTSRFNFYADTNNNGLFDEAALVLGADPIDGQGFSSATFNDYAFSGTVTASRFRAEFVGNTGVTYEGPRVRELDAIAPAAAPEPGSLSLLGMGLAGGAGMVGTVRRRKAKQAA